MAHKNLLKGFKKPKSLDFENSELTKTYGKFVAFPFETGFGTTVGNTLRRILLSSIQGYAVSAVHIVSYNEDGVAHTISSEFENIPGVSEDTLEILSRLKHLDIKLSNDVEEGTFLFEFSGEKVVLSTDFNREGAVEILGEPFEIMHLMKDSKIELELQIDLSRGFVSADMNARYVDVIGTIALDAVYSPVKKVAYNIEPCRVGQRSDYDKLILEIWTNGTVTPEDALGKAGKIAKEYFSVFINFDESDMDSEDDVDKKDEAVAELLATPVERLELTVRAMNVLNKANIRTLGELVKKTETEISGMRNVGQKCLTEIQEKLQEFNLQLGMTDYSHLRDNIIVNTQKEETDEA
ncbi:MAG: DNA-directed RNA polymerase subunit alpha [Treponema sp.]